MGTITIGKYIQNRIGTHSFGFSFDFRLIMPTLSRHDLPAEEQCTARRARPAVAGPSGGGADLY